MSTKRTRLKAVYLTETERDLVVHALTALRDQLIGTHNGSGWLEKFACSHTAKRIFETTELFLDKPTTKGKP